MASIVWSFRPPAAIWDTAARVIRSGRLFAWSGEQVSDGRPVLKSAHPSLEERNARRAVQLFAGVSPRTLLEDKTVAWVTDTAKQVREALGPDVKFPNPPVPLTLSKEASEREKFVEEGVALARKPHPAHQHIVAAAAMMMLGRGIFTRSLRWPQARGQ